MEIYKMVLEFSWCLIPFQQPLQIDYKTLKTYGCIFSLIIKALFMFRFWCQCCLYNMRAEVLCTMLKSLE